MSAKVIFSLDRLMGFNLHGRKVAVIGTGNIGKAFCRILKGFGCHISAYDIYPDQQLANTGVVYGTLMSILAAADVVSLHCPLTEDTKNMINEHSLKLFKPGAMLINTSRGGLVKTTDVIEALKSGQSTSGSMCANRSGSFFHDHSEDVIQDDMIMRLISFPNVLVTSHQGFTQRSDGGNSRYQFQVNTRRVCWWWGVSEYGEPIRIK